MKENTKITLTIGQLRKLVKESRYKIHYTYTTDGSDSDAVEVVDANSENDAVEKLRKECDDDGDVFEDVISIKELKETRPTQREFDPWNNVDDFQAAMRAEMSRWKEMKKRGL